MEILKEIVLANYQQGGLKTLCLYDLNPTFFSNLAVQCLDFAKEFKPSIVTEKDHVTEWTKPFGEAKQYSLFNISGNTADTSCDHNLNNGAKKFHYKEKYPAIANFVSLMESLDLMGMRLNYLGPDSGLSYHKEHIVSRNGNAVNIKARFHLPIKTNPYCRMFLDGEWFKYQEGKIYFFNNGCVHSARNDDPKLGRYHLVWDMNLSVDCFEYLFDGGLAGDFFHAVRNRKMRSIGEDDIKDFETYGNDIPFCEALEKAVLA